MACTIVVLNPLSQAFALLQLQLASSVRCALGLSTSNSFAGVSTSSRTEPAAAAVVALAIDSWLADFEVDDAPLVHGAQIGDTLAQWRSGSANVPLTFRPLRALCETAFEYLQGGASLLFENPSGDAVVQDMTSPHLQQSLTIITAELQAAAILLAHPSATPAQARSSISFSLDSPCTQHWSQALSLSTSAVTRRHQRLARSRSELLRALRFCAVPAAQSVLSGSGASKLAPVLLHIVLHAGNGGTQFARSDTMLSRLQHFHVFRFCFLQRLLFTR